MTDDTRYWIAINGASCAISSMPMRNPMVTPTPQQMIGFPTLEEAQDAQRICLTASMDEVRRFMKSLRPDVGSGRVRVTTPDNPQPPTRGPTSWTESAKVHEVVQRTFIKTTSN
jgi:hypothetical protein